MKSHIAALIGELSESGARFNPDDPRFDARATRAALAAAGVEMPSADGLVWVSMTADGRLADIEFRPEALRADERRIAAGVTAAVQQAEQVVEAALAAMRERQRKAVR